MCEPGDPKIRTRTDLMTAKGKKNTRGQIEIAMTLVTIVESEAETLETIANEAETV